MWGVEVWFLQGMMQARQTLLQKADCLLRLAFSAYCGTMCVCVCVCASMNRRTHECVCLCAWVSTRVLAYICELLCKCVYVGMNARCCIHVGRCTCTAQASNTR